jgi:hypothetical protein
MASSRWTRLGASVLVSLLVSAGLTSTVLGASPTDPVPGPIGSTTVTHTPTPAIAPATAPATDTKPATSPATEPPTRSAPALPYDGPPTAINPAGAIPATLFTISGTITGSTTLDGVGVQATSSDSGIGRYTLAGGAYSLPVPAGNYVLSFQDPTGRYINGYYASSLPGHFTLSQSSATTFNVGSDVIIPPVALQTGYHIAGTVTGPGGAPLEGIDVSVASSGNLLYSITGPGGSYSVTVPPGVYDPFFHDPSGTYLNGHYASGWSVAVNALYADTVTVSSSDRTISVQMLWPWSTTLYASATSVTVGTSVTLTAAVNQNIFPTPYYTSILAGGGIIASCSSGIACITSVTSSIPASLTYHAMVGRADGTWAVSASDTVTVTWTPHHIVVSPANATISAGSSQAYKAEGYNAASQDLGDVTSATTFTISGGGSCTGAVCTSTVPGDHTVTGTNGSAISTAALRAVGATYVPLTPNRVLDTRTGTGGLSGPLTNHVARTFNVAGVPYGAIAVTGNLTVTGQTSSGYLFIGPVPMNNPGSSTLNFPVGDDRANAVTVALSGGGTLSITFVAPSNGPTAQAIFDVTGYFTPDTSGATYHALSPTRALDTRNGTGGLSGPFTNHAARTFTVNGVPAGAIAVTGNLTVTGQTSSGYLFIGPVATDNPGSSTLNFPVGDDRANAVTVALGTGRTLSITFVAPSNGPSAQAIFDVTGYFTADMSGATYVPLTPNRVLDTRNGTGGLAGPFSNHAARTFTVAGVPAGAIAVTGNLTVTGQTSSGYLFIGPVATDNPGSSTLNFPVGDDRANAVTVALGGGTLSITFVASSNGPTAHAIFDVTGYFVPGS